MVNIVVLDGHTLNPGDLSWAPLQALGTVALYPRTPPDQVVERSRGADIILTNKVVLDAAVLAELPVLQCIVVTATGYNNIDLAAAANQGVRVCNAVGYGTEAVAQHVFALLLELTNQVGLHNQSVQQGDWSAQPDFCYWKKPIIGLHGRTMGIFGFGRIGQKVARIALALGMKVLATHRHPERDAMVGVSFVPLDRLFAGSDVVLLTVPLTPKTQGIVDASLLALLKTSAYLINTGRGELIREDDLAAVLRAGSIAGAALDVLDGEPPRPDHPLFGLDNCLITPHQAWASRESRQKLLDITVDNVRGFLQGAPQNVVI